MEVSGLWSWWSCHPLIFVVICHAFVIKIGDSKTLQRILYNHYQPSAIESIITMNIFHEVFYNTIVSFTTVILV